jgi:hypothetical protein
MRVVLASCGVLVLVALMVGAAAAIARSGPEMRKPMAASGAQACRQPVDCTQCPALDEKLYERFYEFNDSIPRAYERRDLDEVARLAREYLALAPSLPCDWNYGNAVHDGHRWLGLVALQQGDEAAAVRHLLEAGRSPGSPQLDSFGPRFDLAQALLGRGHAGAVTTYLRDINRFWDRAEVEEWIAAIERGERPRLDLMASLPRKAMRILLGVLAWPALAVGLAYVAVRKRIARKDAFVVIAGVAGYGAMFLVLAVAALGAFFLDDPGFAIAVMPYAAWVVPTLVFLLPVAAVVIVARRFRQAAQSR